MNEVLDGKQELPGRHQWPNPFTFSSFKISPNSSDRKRQGISAGNGQKLTKVIVVDYCGSAGLRLAWLSAPSVVSSEVLSELESGAPAACACSACTHRWGRPKRIGVVVKSHVHLWIFGLNLFFSPSMQVHGRASDPQDFTFSEVYKNVHTMRQIGVMQDDSLVVGRYRVERHVVVLVHFFP